MAATEVKQQGSSNFWPAFLLAILILLLGVLGFLLLEKKMTEQTITGTSKLGNVSAETAGQAGGSSTASGGGDLKTIIHQDQNLVVQLQVQDAGESAIGSGFLYDDKGDVITNAHVVGGASQVTVKTADKSLYQGVVIGRGSDVDIALVRVKQLAGLAPLKMARQPKGEVGDNVLAFGSPLGLDNSVTTGIISGVNRDLTIEGTNYKNMLQISAPIAPGNSGGPLVLQKTNEVVGVNSAGAKQGNIGFSIPITQVLPLVDKWAQNPAAQNSTATAPAATQPVGPAQTTDSSNPFTGNSSVDSKQSPADSQVTVDLAQNLVGRYYDSLNVQDYVTAYALLGSDWQKQASYNSFRSGYLSTESVTIKNITGSSNDDNSANVTAIIEAQEHMNDGTRRTSQYKVTYKVGYENNQLRLLQGSAEKI